jgi:hypothetical protein
MNDGAIPIPARRPKIRLNNFSPGEGALYSRSAGITGILFCGSSFVLEHQETP